jgi:hypothetical protein
LEPNKLSPFFTTGDIFSLFSDTVLTHSIDLKQTYLETETRAQPTKIAPISNKPAMSDASNAYGGSAHTGAISGTTGNN